MAKNRFLVGDEVVLINCDETLVAQGLERGITGKVVKINDFCEGRVQSCFVVCNKTLVLSEETRKYYEQIISNVEVNKCFAVWSRDLEKVKNNKKKIRLGGARLCM